LVGETGTGKGCCADFIHFNSDLHYGPFIQFNCGTGPENLFESQLFGHAKGAFTGADNTRVGLVEDANNGTLFLDEINSLSLSSQVKLNTFLETGKFRRVGESKIRQVETRIIAASNCDIQNCIATGSFRDDLYYRISEYEVTLPPLRARGGDIIELANFFLKKFHHLNPQYSPFSFSQEAIIQLTDYSWPGNIRELQNVLKRAIIESTSPILEYLTIHKPKRKSTIASHPDLTWKEAKKAVIEDFEREYIHTLLQRYNGIVANCARHAGLQSPDFWKLMRKYNISAEYFRMR
ncbi:MAG: sigma-54-dependent Fis family transcriptional regulator, partial [Calditrichaeota bacterium]